MCASVCVLMCASVFVFQIFLHVAHLYSTQSFCETGNFFMSLLLPNQTTKLVWVMTERTQISPSAGLWDSSLRKEPELLHGISILSSQSLPPPPLPGFSCVPGT